MKEKERNIRDVFGLDYLLNAAPPPPIPSSSSSRPEQDEAVAFGGPIAAPSLIEQARQTRRLRQMSDVLARLQPLGGKGDFYTLLDQTPLMNIDLSELLGVAADMEKGGLIQVISKDRRGNWEVEMTPAGREFLRAMS